MKLGLFLCIAVLGLPVAWLVLSSVTPEAALFDGEGSAGVVFDHYAAVFRERSFRVALWNSLVVSTVSTASCVFAGTLAAYALTRLRFPGSRAALLLLLCVSMFPQVSIVAPLYLALRAAGLIDTHAGLVLPYLTFAMPLTVFQLSAYFRQLPEELEQAARVDGASRLRVLREITLPLAIPGIVTTAVITFIFCWNEFLFALAFTVTSEHHTVPVALALLRGQHRIPWGTIFAASVVACVPVVALVAAFQRRIVAGLTAGAVKG